MQSVKAIFKKCEIQVCECLYKMHLRLQVMQLR